MIKMLFSIIRLLEITLTTVGVNKFGVDEANFEVVEHGRLMEVAESCEVILSHQDVWVPQVRQVLRLRVQFVLDDLSMSQVKRNLTVKAVKIY